MMEEALGKGTARASKADFCELKHVLEEAQPLLSDGQLLEMADDMHDAIRERHGDPISGASECPKQ